MIKSPKVIFNSIFTLALNNHDSKYKIIVKVLKESKNV